MAVLAEMASAIEAQDSPPQGLFVVGSGVDIASVKEHLEGLVSLPVSAPEESALALARGAALAAANAPAFEATTVGLAYSQDPDGTTAGNEYAGVVSAAAMMRPVDTDAPPMDDDYAFVDVDHEPVEEGRKPFLLVGSALTAIFVIGVVALVISLAVSIRPTVDSAARSRARRHRSRSACRRWLRPSRRRRPHRRSLRRRHRRRHPWKPSSRRCPSCRNSPRPRHAPCTSRQPRRRPRPRRRPPHRRRPRPRRRPRRRRRCCSRPSGPRRCGARRCYQIPARSLRTPWNPWPQQGLLMTMTWPQGSQVVAWLQRSGRGGHGGSGPGGRGGHGGRGGQGNNCFLIFCG